MVTVLSTQEEANFRRLTRFADWLDSTNLTTDTFEGDPSKGFFREESASVTEPFEGFNFLIGRSSYFRYKSQIPTNVVVGRHTSINATAVIGAVNHRFTGLTTGFIDLGSSLQPIGSEVAAIRSKVVPTVIGCDVWIGANAVVLDGQNVGHGAVIGAGAVVTRPIPPYAIAVGVPARILRYRFGSNIRTRLLASAWWTLPVAFLASLPLDNVMACLSRIEARSQIERAAGTMNDA